MIQNFNSKQMYKRMQNKATVSDNEKIDNLDEISVVAIGLTPEDGDIDDVDVASVPEWDQMLNILAKMDGMTEETI